MSDDPIELFDQFILKYVRPELHGHLMDTDDNAAERVREAIRAHAGFIVRRPRVRWVPIHDREPHGLAEVTGLTPAPYYEPNGLDVDGIE